MVSVAALPAPPCTPAETELPPVMVSSLVPSDAMRLLTEVRLEAARREEPTRLRSPVSGQEIMRLLLIDDEI